MAAKASAGKVKDLTAEEVLEKTFTHLDEVIGRKEGEKGRSRSSRRGPAAAGNDEDRTERETVSEGADEKE